MVHSCGAWSEEGEGSQRRCWKRSERTARGSASQSRARERTHLVRPSGYSRNTASHPLSSSLSASGNHTTTYPTSEAQTSSSSTARTASALAPFARREERTLLLIPAYPPRSITPSFLRPSLSWLLRLPQSRPLPSGPRSRCTVLIPPAPASAPLYTLSERTHRDPHRTLARTARRRPWSGERGAGERSCARDWVGLGGLHEGVSWNMEARRRDGPSEDRSRRCSIERLR